MKPIYIHIISSWGTKKSGGGVGGGCGEGKGKERKESIDRGDGSKYQNHHKEN